jgi:2-phosphosulfolactate phosphatase
MLRLRGPAPYRWRMRDGLRIRYATLVDCHTATDLVVVVDVIRAFTTAAHLFDRGAAAILPVAAIDEARALRRADPGVVLAGEEGGMPIDGFDLGNSPSQLDGVDVAGATVVQRTSAGTQGVARSSAADRMLVASFVCATATVRAIHRLATAEVTFVLTGVDHRDGEEDRACAEYVAALVGGDDPDPGPYVRRAWASSAAQWFLDEARPDFPLADLELATQVDRFDAAMVVERGARDIIRAAHPSSR